VIFLGDWAPGSDVFNIQIEEDLFFVNLEGIIELNSEKIKIPKFHEYKAGPILINKTLPNFGKPTIFNLANNHFNDLGRDYAINTIKLIEDRQDRHIGYGLNDVDSQKPIIFEYQQVKIGLIAFCEKQFGESGFNRPGVACYNPWVFEQITSLKKICDYVIVSAHAGSEDVPLPLPYWKNVYRSFIKVGANLVIGHHPHVPQGFEYFEKGFICDGVGNVAVPPNPIAIV
jgi:poly-gamma-glutamate synthesis protein (capsule biosynthesis protein)